MIGSAKNKKYMMYIAAPHHKAILPQYSAFDE